MAVIQGTTAANYWCDRLCHRVRKELGPGGGDGAIGLDVEWRPSFKPNQPARRSAILQLSGPGLCLIIQLQRLSHIPRQLGRLLRDPTLPKVGVSVEEDLARLREDWGLSSRCFVDVGRVGGRVFPEGAPFRIISLQKLMGALWGICLPKPQSIRLGNWETPELSSRQVEYAALDAMAGRAIYQAFHRRGLLDKVTLEELMLKWSLSSDEKDLKRARSLALESDLLRHLYVRFTGLQPTRPRAGNRRFGSDAISTGSKDKGGSSSRREGDRDRSGRSRTRGSTLAPVRRTIVVSEEPFSLQEIAVV